MIGSSASIVERYSSYLHTKNIEAFHAAQFHGVAWRGEDSKNDFTTYYLGNGPYVPLSLSLNVFRINDVIQPIRSLVISERARAALVVPMQAIFLQTNVKSAFIREYAEEDFSHWEKGYRFEDTRTYYRKQRNDPNAVAKCPTYYE